MAESVVPRELHLKDYLDTLLRRKWIAILFFSIVVLTVTIGSFVVVPIYRATVTLLIDVESPNVLTATGMVALESQHYYSYKEYYQSQQEILTSPGILRKVFDEFSLAGLPEYKESRDPLKRFRKTVKAEPMRDTRLMKLYVENKDPVMARNIANRIAEIYVKRNLYYISRDELVNLLKNEYLKLEAKMSEYTKVYKHKHPKMIRIKQEMAEMSAKIEHAKRSTFDIDLVTDEELDGGYKYALSGFKANNVSVQDFADLPVVPAKPKKKINIVIAVFIGFFGGLLLAFFTEYLDDTVKTSDEIEQLTRWGYLGGVPDLRRAIGRLRQRERDMIVHKRPKDPIAEVYRSIRTNILFSERTEHPHKCFVITSPSPEEGKTSIVANLGIIMAQSNRHVLLVDADMRKPRLHTIFGKSNEQGLSSILSRLPKFEDIVQKTDIENLFIIPSGPHPPNPAELLSSYAMEQFVKQVKQKFDIILFDAPPMAVVTDASILSRVTDAVIIVLESGKTSRKVVQHLASTFQESNAKVLGTILNKIAIQRRDSYYYYRSYYGK